MAASAHTQGEGRREERKQTKQTTEELLAERVDEWIKELLGKTLKWKQSGN